MNRHQRRYTAQFRATALAALAANRGNVKKTARQLGLPRQTLNAWSLARHHPEALVDAKAVSRSLADRFEEVALKMLPLIPEKAKAKNVKLLDVVIAAAICTDLSLALRGQLLCPKCQAEMGLRPVRRY